MPKGFKAGGRETGTRNKIDATARAAIAAIADGMAIEFVEWVREVAIENPAEAASIWLKAIEYHIPKLARTEVTGKDGDRLIVQIVRHADDTNT